MADGGYPDIDALLRDWLKPLLGIQQIHIGGPEDVPANLPTIVPLIMIERFGGGDTVPGLDHANVDIDVFASSLAAAKAIAGQVLRLIRIQLPGQRLGGVSTISKTRIISHPVREDWDADSVRRVSAAYRISQHAPI